MLNTITTKDMPGMAKALKPFALKVCVARATHEVLAEEMAAVDTALLRKREYLDDEGARVTDAADSWNIAPDAQYDIFAADRQEYVSMKYPELEHGFCPALVAESALREAKKALLKAASEFVPEFGHPIYDMELESSIIETLMGLAIQRTL